MVDCHTQDLPWLLFSILCIMLGLSYSVLLHSTSHCLFASLCSLDLVLLCFFLAFILTFCRDKPDFQRISIYTPIIVGVKWTTYILIGSVQKRIYTNIGACRDKRIYPYILNWTEMNDLTPMVAVLQHRFFPSLFSKIWKQIWQRNAAPAKSSVSGAHKRAILCDCRLGRCFVM